MAAGQRAAQRWDLTAELWLAVRCEVPTAAQQHVVSRLDLMAESPPLVRCADPTAAQQPDSRV